MIDFDKMSDEEIAEWYDTHDSITGRIIFSDTAYAVLGDKICRLVGSKWVELPTTYTK